MERQAGAYRWSKVLLVVTVVMVMAGYALYPSVADLAHAAGREDLVPSGLWFGVPPVALAFSVTGWLIHRHEPHPVGWLLHGVGICFASTEVGTVLAVFDGVGWELDAVARLLVAWTGFGWIPAIVLMTVFLPLLFPTGRPPSRRWWWVAAVGAAGLVYAFMAVTLDAATGPLDEILPEEASWIVVVVFMATGAVGATASAVARFLRAEGIERRQLMWVSASLVLVGGTVAFALTPLAGDVLTRTPAQLVEAAVWGTIPVSIGIAITRYHLYDIDRIVSRTVSYGLVALIVGAVYALVILVIGSILGPRSDLAVAASTLAAAAVFSPARRRIQNAADRRFNRPRYEAQRELDGFAQHLRGEVKLAAVSDDLLGVVDRTLQPSSLALWIRSPR